MITISILGLDQYVVGHYSGDNTKNLANLYEVSEDDISFYAPNCYMFHNGVEQTSWNTLVRVHAPERFKVFESKISHYLLNTLKNFSINVAVEFFYYDEHHRYEYINESYPRFLTEDNLVNVEEEELGEDEELYEGNIFEGYEDKLEEAYKESEECDDEECKCHHHHH